MKIEKSLSWMLVGGALLAGSGCTSESDGRVTSMYATSGGQALALRGVALDRATYDKLVNRLGEVPTDIALDDGAPDGSVVLDLAPTSPLVAGYLAPTPGTLPPLSITFDNGTPEPIGLLLPAVQKVREAAMHGSGGPKLEGTLTITLDGAATVGGGVYVAAGDVTGDGHDAPTPVFVVGTPVPGTAPEQRTMMAGAFASPTGIDRARLVAADGGFELAELAIPDSQLTGVWGASGTQMNLFVDGNGKVDPLTDGLLLIRYMIGGATAIPGATRPQGHVKVFNGSTGQLSRNGDAERAMFDAGFATWTSDSLDLAARVLTEFKKQASTSQAVAWWNINRTTSLADIIVGTGPGAGPAAYEAMACAAALPTAVTVAKSLDLTDDAAASAVATVMDAVANVTPTVGLVAGGSLAVQAYGASAPSGDAQLACAAVHQLAQLPATLETIEGKAIRAMSVELAAFDARYLDVELASWIADIDDLILTPDDNAWNAARAKADILIEAFASASTRTASRWSMTKTLLGK